MKYLSRLLIFFVLALLPLQAQSVDVCFVTLHPAAARHFARFTEELDRSQITWKILAGESAETLLREQKISHHKISIWTGKKGIKNLSVEEQGAIAKLIAKECKKAKIVMTDVSEPLIASIHHELALISSAKRYIYYDNPEPYVPGEYSKCLTALINTRPEGILFANYHLAKEEVFGEHRRPLECERMEKVGLGFYPLEDVQTLQMLMEKKAELRDRLFKELGIADEQQKILLYLGGANTPYFEQAFPFFLNALQEHTRDPFFDNILFLLQQHPRAKEEAIDLYALLSQAFPFQVFTSPLPSLEAVACSDLTYYYQTSMVPYLVLAGVPLVQVAPIPCEDMGVKMGLIEVVRDAKDLPMASIGAIAQVHAEVSLKAFKEGLGYDNHWPEHLTALFKKYL